MPPSTDYHLPSPYTQSDEDNLARPFVPPKAEESMTRPQSAQDELSESTVQTREESATPARRYPRRLNRKDLIAIVTRTGTKIIIFIRTEEM